MKCKSLEANAWMASNQADQTSALGSFKRKGKKGKLRPIREVLFQEIQQTRGSADAQTELWTPVLWVLLLFALNCTGGVPAPLPSALQGTRIRAWQKGTAEMDLHLKALHKCTWRARPIPYNIAGPSS